MPADIFNGEAADDVKDKINASFGNSAFVPFPNGIRLSGGSDTLATYEEGTFTATISDAASAGNTGTTATWCYTKIGDQLYFEGKIENMDTTGMTGANTLFIQGLPFAGSVGEAVFPVQIRQWIITGSYVVGRISSVGTVIEFRNVTSTTNGSFVIVSDLTSPTADIFISGFYNV